MSNSPDLPSKREPDDWLIIRHSGAVTDCKIQGDHFTKDCAAIKTEEKS